MWEFMRLKIRYIHRETNGDANVFTKKIKHVSFDAAEKVSLDL